MIQWLRDVIIGVGQAFDPLPISRPTFEQDDCEAMRKDVEAVMGDMKSYASSGSQPSIILI